MITSSIGKANLPDIIGVLDWEMATVGDPGMDLGASLAYWAEKGDSELTKLFNISWLPGNLTEKKLLNGIHLKVEDQLPTLYFIMYSAYTRML